MSDIKISDMQPWVGAVNGNVEFPAVFGNENYRIALSQLTTTTFGFGSMALQNSNSVSITGGNVAVTALSGAITIANGGTGLGSAPGVGQVLIGTGTTYSLSTLTAGSGIAITNAAGAITIAATGGTGTVTSVDVSGGSTGLTFSNGPIVSAGTITMAGTLAVANGGTGAANATAARAALSAAKSGANSDITSITGLTTPLSTVQGGTGAIASLSGYIVGNGGSPFTSVATIPISDLTGTLPIANGGTNATTAPAARVNLLPSYTNNAGKVLALNVGATDVEWFALTGLGTVTSVSGTGTVNGITLTGTVTAAGDLTLGGTLSGVSLTTQVSGILPIANGGTNATSAGAALTSLGAAASGANIDITSIALTTGTVTATPVNGTDIVNKVYADSVAAGLNFHQSVRLATAVALPANTYNNGVSGVGATLTANANGALSVDGVLVVANNRILVKNEAAQANNGIYTVTQVGNGSTPYILTRATDFDSAGAGVDQIDAGDFFLVTAGATQSNTSWVQQTPLPITVGATALVFTQFAAPVLYSAGTGLTLAGTVFSITNTGVSVSTYGSASQVPVLAVNAQGQITSASNASIAIDTSQITSGTLPVANGGTGQASYTNGQLLIGNTAGNTLVAATLTAGTNISISNGPGSITINATDQFVGTVTSVSGTGTVNGITLTGTVTSSGSLTLGGTLSGVSLTTQVSGILPVANGGTNATATPTAGAVAYGTGTAYAFTTAGNAGQVLVSTGGTAPAFGGIDGGTF